MKVVSLLLVVAIYLALNVALISRCLSDLREYGHDLQVLHEAAVFKHGRSTLEVAALHLYGLATDTARRLGHVHVETVDNALLLINNIEWLLLLGQVELTEFDGTKCERSRHLLAESLREVFWIV